MGEQGEPIVFWLTRKWV